MIEDKEPQDDPCKSIFTDIFKSKMFGLVSAVQTFGSQKHGRNTWQQEYDSVKNQDSLFGHLYSAIYLKQKFDLESGLPNLGHAACRLMYLIEKEVEGTFGRDYVQDIEQSVEEATNLLGTPTSSSVKPDLDYDLLVDSKPGALNCKIGMVYAKNILKYVLNYHKDNDTDNYHYTKEVSNG